MPWSFQNRNLRRAMYLVVGIGVLSAVLSGAIPLDIFSRAMRLMASAVWGS
jgi:hypothetical protein